MKSVILHPQRCYSLTRRHPWIFSGAIAKVQGSPAPGETVKVLSADNTPLAVGAYSPSSQIRVRLWSCNPEEQIDEGFLKTRIASAIGMRAPLMAHNRSNALRLINAEADLLPGLIVDRYDQWLVCQFTTAAAEFWRASIIGILQALLPCAGIYERSDTEARAREDLPARCGPLYGGEPPPTIEIMEHGLRYLVDPRQGHKTGFYLDQRDNRALVREYANGAEVLNCFAYTGGFGIAALDGAAAQVTHVEQSAEALELARRNTALNTCHAADSTFTRGNVFSILREYRDQGRSFDLIVLDPPKFADTKSALMRAARGYKDINLLAIKLLRRGGCLATFSCSGAVTADFFRKLVSDAAVDAGRDLQIVRQMSQAEDHPTGLCHPEGTYLKGLLCRATT